MPEAYSITNGLGASGRREALAPTTRVHGARARPCVGEVSYRRYVQLHRILIALLLMPLGSFISYQYNEGLASTTSHYTLYTGCVPAL